MQHKATSGLSEIPKEVPGAFLAMAGSGDRTRDLDEIPVNFQVSSRQSRRACVVPDDQGQSIVILTPLSENESSLNRKLFPPFSDALCKSSEGIDWYQQENLISSSVCFIFYQPNYPNKGNTGLILERCVDSPKKKFGKEKRNSKAESKPH